MKIWLRVGDVGDYHSFDDIEHIVYELKITNYWWVKSPIYWTAGGFTTSDFEGRDYISCYWGDDEGNHCRDLKPFEKRKFQKLLREHDPEVDLYKQGM